jgi:hypothetical protein
MQSTMYRGYRIRYHCESEWFAHTISAQRVISAACRQGHRSEHLALRTAQVNRNIPPIKDSAFARLRSGEQVSHGRSVPPAPAR